MSHDSFQTNTDTRIIWISNYT